MSTRTDTTHQLEVRRGERGLCVRVTQGEHSVSIYPDDLTGLIRSVTWSAKTCRWGTVTFDESQARSVESMLRAAVRQAAIR